MTVAEICRAEGIGLQTLYNWRDKAKLQGHPVPGKNLLPNSGKQILSLQLLLKPAQWMKPNLASTAALKGSMLSK